jgi:hypothetical protein
MISYPKMAKPRYNHFGYEIWDMQTPALGGILWLSPDAKIPQRLIQRGFSGFQGIFTEIGMVRPAGIEPATPAFGVLNARHNLL